ncbi:hypothetical protein BY996DRAFT_6423923 [Phakopsora pachyrhizi]|nr:hypothetical protein BY996DRAFT_6423923 [Phakopsora pachyrhizi]
MVGTIKDSTRKALLSTTTLMLPAQKIPDIAPAAINSKVKFKTPWCNQSPASSKVIQHPHSNLPSKSPSPPPADIIIDTSINFSPNDQEKTYNWLQKKQSLNLTYNSPVETSSNLQPSDNSWALIPGWLKSATKLTSLKSTTKLGSKQIIASTKKLVHSFGESDATLEASLDDYSNGGLKPIFGKCED